jgi:hypothetical protein
MCKSSFTLWLLLILNLSAIAQTQSNCVCCTVDHRSFDFWLGEWRVYDTLGNQLGKNTIVKAEKGCLITENWRGVTGGTGRSMNYFDPQDSTWNQLWISASGTILNLKGKSDANRMTLRSELLRGQNNQPYHHQISWSLNPDSTVTQHWVILDEAKKVTAEAFKGIYIRED